MRAEICSSTIGSMLIHPDILLELARRRHEDLLADARRRRIATLATRFAADRGPSVLGPRHFIRCTHERRRRGQT
jgi:hypothetical protein